MLLSIGRIVDYEVELRFQLSVARAAYATFARYTALNLQGCMHRTALGIENRERHNFIPAEPNISKFFLLGSQGSF